jgi:tetratricopeptide (TPR) repeat protein
MSQILERAEATRALGGGRIRTLDPQRVTFALLVVIFGALLGLSSMGLPTSVAALGAVLATLGLFVALRTWWSRGIRANNDGVEALSLDRFDEAERGFRSIVTRRHPRSYTALGLQNLSTVALQRGEIEDAAILARAALEILSRSRPHQTAELVSGHVRANYAFALLASGEVDEAEAVLRAPAEPGALAKSEALLVRSRALALVRREQWQEALDLLTAEKRLLRNTLTGDEAVFAEAMLALVRERLGHSPSPIAVDDDERAFVTRIVPACASVLTTA